MGDRKHIDRIFQERFKDFEVKPDDAVWNNIEAKLNEKKKKRRVIPIWWRYAGVAALLLLMLTIGASLFTNDNTEQITPQIVDTDKTDIENTVNENLQNQNNTNTEDENNAIASDNTSYESTDTIKSTKENNTHPTLNRAVISRNQSSSVANSNTNEEAAQNILNTPSKNTDATIITYRNHITKTDVANNKETKEESIIKDNALVKQNPHIINKPSTNKQTQTTAIVDNTSNQDKTATPNNAVETVTQVSENNVKEEKESIEDAIEKNKSLLEEEKKTEVAFNKWSVAPNVAPVYFSSLGKGSSIDAQFNENSKSGEVNMSYGLNASYAINKRLTIRSGVNRVNLGYNTNDVVVFSSVNASANAKTLNTISSTVPDNMAESTTISAGDNVSIMSATTFKSSSIDALATNNTSINQSFGFIEVPLELQYTLTDKRFGVNVIGGFSSLFLNNYESVSVIEGQTTRLQEADNINNTSYSANFGLGVNYKVTEKINFNLEPMFKYQINTFRNTSGDFQPFFIGVYTGFGIKF